MSVQTNIENQVRSGVVVRWFRSGNFWSRLGVPLVLLAMCLVFSLTSEVFLTGNNIINILRQAAVVAIAAVGATIVLISGGIDISQGAIMALAGIAAVVLVQNFGLPDGIGIVVGLVFAAIAGMINGLLAERV